MWGRIWVNDNAFVSDGSPARRCRRGWRRRTQMMALSGYLLLPPPPPPWGTARSGWLAFPADDELLEIVSAGCPVGEAVTAPLLPVVLFCGATTPGAPGAEGV